MEQNRSLITSRLLAGLKSLKPEQLICGEEYHPRRLPHKVTVPEIMRTYLNRSVFVEITYCQKGTCIINLDNNSFKMKQGDFCIIGRNMVNCEIYAGPRAPYTLVWFFFGHFSFMTMHQSVYQCDGSFKVVNTQRVASDRYLHRKADQIALWGRNEKLEKWDTIKKGLRELFEFYGRQKVRPHTATIGAWHRMVLKQVDKYLWQHLAQKVTLARVAKKFSFSPSYLNTLFKREYNYGIIELLIYYRLRRAAALLVASRLRVNEISRRCGYEDPYYFSRLFRKTFGVSPRQYRNDFA